MTHTNDTPQLPDGQVRSVSYHRRIADVAMGGALVGILGSVAVAILFSRFPSWWLLALACTLVLVPMIVAATITVANPAWRKATRTRRSATVRDLAAYVWFGGALIAGVILAKPVSVFLTTTL